ncbi:MAG: glycosyltransferase family 2 protein [Acidobacteriota bacterium]|nr:glycosyltransferase family 2 protein [Acidobacteriota bacterium]
MKPPGRPRVSVAIPSFNHAPYVVGAVESVLRSDFEGLEVVLVDDGSSDDSLARLKPLESDPRLRVFRQENQGAHAALNRAMSLARGEILFILNSDDLFAPTRIGRFVRRFDEKPSLAGLSSWMRIIDSAGTVLGVKEAFRNMPPWPLSPGGLTETRDPVLALLEANYIATTSNFAVRRAVCDGADGLRFLPLRYAHDWDFFLGAAERGTLEILPEPLVDYRVHASNTIKEGAEEARGQAAMRFEILWVAARHADHVLRQSGLRGHSAEDLARRAAVSLPSFDCRGLLAQLRMARGSEDAPPRNFDHLLAAGHPFRRCAERLLSGRTPPPVANPLL